MGQIFIALVFIAAMFFPDLLAIKAARYDDHKIKEDGSNDSKHYTFHRQNLMRRTLWISLALAAVVFSALYWSENTTIKDVVWLGIAYVLFAGARFGYVFNEDLNLRRGLHPRYVSRDPDAAWTDRTLIKLARRFNETPEEIHETIYLAAECYSAFFLLVQILLFIF